MVSLRWRLHGGGGGDGPVGLEIMADGGPLRGGGGATAGNTPSTVVGAESSSTDPVVAAVEDRGMGSDPNQTVGVGVGVGAVSLGADLLHPASYRAGRPRTRSLIGADGQEIALIRGHELPHWKIKTILIQLRKHKELVRWAISSRFNSPVNR